MSTYGKKALAYWNYEEKNSQDELQRFNSTPHNIQEEILKKWFPIGMEVEKTSKGANEYYGRYTIAKYVKMGYGWRVDIIDDKGYTHYTNNAVHPGNLRPSKEWRREEKLKKLGI